LGAIGTCHTAYGKNPGLPHGISGYVLSTGLTRRCRHIIGDGCNNLETGFYDSLKELIAARPVLCNSDSAELLRQRDFNLDDALDIS
jgi:hypothetical protein